MDTHIRPLVRHPLSLPVRAETRSTLDMLGHVPMARYSELGELMLDHPPVLLVHDEGGEELLNRDVVMEQLGLNEKKKNAKPVSTPSTLVAWVITSSSLKGLTVLALRFLFGKIQLLHYRKVDGSDNLLAHIAVDSLINDENLARTISREFFGTSIMQPQHLSVLFFSANLGVRSIGSLSKKYKDALEEKGLIPKKKSRNKHQPKNKTNEKNGKNKEKIRPKNFTHAKEENKEAVDSREENSNDIISQGVEKFYRYSRRAEEQLHLKMEKTQ